MTMMDRLFNFSSWKIAGGLLGFNFILQALILLVIYPMISTTTTPLDVQIGLTPDLITSYFNEIGEVGRKYYLLNEMTIDMLFPLVYSFAYALLLVELIKSLKLTGSAVKYIALLPFGIGLSDIIENTLIITGLQIYPTQNSTFESALIYANMAKHGLTFVALLSVCIFVIWLVFSKVSRRKTQSN